MDVWHYAPSNSNHRNQLASTVTYIYKYKHIYIYTGWPKKVSHHQFKKNCIKDCQRD